MGSVYFIAGIVLLLLVLGAIASTVFLIPAVVVVLVALVWLAQHGWKRVNPPPPGSPDPDERRARGVPSTREATYDPVQEPPGV